MGFKDRCRIRLAATLLLAAGAVAPALARTVLDLDPAAQPVALQDWAPGSTPRARRSWTT